MQVLHKSSIRGAGLGHRGVGELDLIVFTVHHNIALDRVRRVVELPLNIPTLADKIFTSVAVIEGRRLDRLARVGVYDFSVGGHIAQHVACGGKLGLRGNAHRAVSVAHVQLLRGVGLIAQYRTAAVARGFTPQFQISAHIGHGHDAHVHAVAVDKASAKVVGGRDGEVLGEHDDSNRSWVSLDNYYYTRC